MAMKTIAIRSSISRMPTTSSRSRPRIPCSSNALAMIVVLEIATIAPVNTLSITVHPKSRPVRNPSHAMKLDWTIAVNPAAGPTRTSFARWNSRPRENISRMTPSSDSVWIMPGSATIGIGTCGPTISPAMM
jgi:hypothetical protein